MAWACMAGNGTGTMMFINTVTAYRGSWINSYVYQAVLSALVLFRQSWQRIKNNP